MARPTKQGVDYFPLDVHLDNKFKFIEIKYGIRGFGVVIKMMQYVYAQGFWADWGEDEKILFSDENKVDLQELESITDECVKRKIFNKELFEKHKILTSEGIQKRYREITRRRRNVEVVSEYVLIDGLKGVNVNKDGASNKVIDDNVSSTGSQQDNKSTQSKVKESKVKESKGKESKKETSEKTSKKSLRFDDTHLKLAKLLFSFMKRNNPNVKEPNLEGWANTFRLMMENDKREGREVQDLIVFSQSHDFWHKNILSANKLRKQYDRLILEMKDDKRLKVVSGGAKSEANQTSYETDYAEYDFSKKGNLRGLPSEN